MLSQYFLNFLIWEATTILTYYTSYLSFKTVTCSSKVVPILDRCCILNGNKFDVQHIKFTKPELRVNTRFIMLYSIAVFFLGNKYKQIDPLTDVYTLLYCLIPPFSAFVMSYMGNVKGLQTSCSKHSIKDWPLLSWIVYITTTIVVLPLYVYNVYLIYVEEGLETFLCYFMLILAIVMFEFTLYKMWDTNRNIHIHHLFIGTMGSTLFRSNSPWIVPIAMILYGVGVEGASNYGFPDIFEG